MPAWGLFLALVIVLALLQGALLLLARGLGLRLHRHAIAVGLVLPWVLLAPWLSPHVLLAPTGSLSGQVPGGPLAERVPHDLLNDTVFQFLPWELEVRHAWKAGRLPLWSDLLGGGSCLWCNPQAGALSPIALVARPLPIQYFLLVTLALKVLLAFQGTWLLARSVGASRRAALVASASFALGGGILAWSLFPHTRAAAWIPWVVAGAIRVTRRPRAARIAASAVATGALLLEGHPETAVAGGLLAAWCALALRRSPRHATTSGTISAAVPVPVSPPARAPRSRGRRGWRSGGLRGLGAAAGAATLGFGLASPQLLPFLSLVPHTVRAQETIEEKTLPGEVRLADPLSWFFEGRGLFWLAPANRHTFGRPYEDPFDGPLSWPDATAPYAGLLAFGGALAALLAAGRRGSRRRASRPFLLAAGVALLLASYPLPLMRLLYLIPPLRAPAYTRLLLVVPLCLAVAGALGLDLLLRRTSGLRPWFGLAAATALSLVVRPEPFLLLLWLLLWAAVLSARRRGGGGARLLRAGVLLPGSSEAAARDDLGRPGTVSRGRSAGAGLCAESPPSPAPVPGRSSPRPPPARAWAGLSVLRGRAGLLSSVLLATALLADLLPWARAHLPAGEPALFYPATAAMEAIRAELAAGGPWRAVGEDYLAYPEVLPVYGIADPRPHNPMAPADQLAVLGAAFDFAPTRVRYFAPFRRPDHPLLDFLNVRLVLSNVYLPLPAGLEPVDLGASPPFRFLRNPEALPRWFLASGAEGVEPGHLAGWIAAMGDPLRVAVPPEEAGSFSGTPESGNARASCCRLAAVDPAPGRLTLELPPAEAGAAGDRLLATSLPGPRGWRARSATGASLRTVTLNGAFLGVAVPPGVERLALRFRPPGLVAGLALAVAASLGLALITVPTARRLVHQ